MEFPREGRFRIASSTIPYCNNTLPESWNTRTLRVAQRCGKEKRKQNKRENDQLARGTRKIGRSEVAHSTARVTGMELGAQSFGGLVGGIEGSREVRNDDLTALAPFLNGEMLDVDVAGARSRFVLVDHGNGGHVVHMKDGGSILLVAQLEQDPTEVLSRLGGMDCSQKLSFGRGGSTDGLELGLVSDSTAGQGEDVASDGPTSFEISAMGSIHMANQSSEGGGRETAKSRIKNDGVNENSGQGRNGFSSPIKDTPIAGTTQVATNLLESEVVLAMGRSAEAAEEGDSVADVRATEDVSIR
jgi:hypothetical protein